MTAIQFLFINSLHELVGLGAWEFVVSHPNRKGRGLDGAPDVRGEIDRRRSSGAEALVGLVGFFRGLETPGSLRKNKSTGRGLGGGSLSYPTLDKNPPRRIARMGHPIFIRPRTEKAKDKATWRL
jgi:hypothetical protein